MEPDETAMTQGRSVEDLHRLRLKALLHDLVRARGQRGTARVLGVNRRTVAACMESGEMSWRMLEALERGLQSGAGTAAAKQRERIEGLEQRVEALAKELHEAVEAGSRTLREEHAQAVRGLERRLAALESRKSKAGATEVASAVERPEARATFRREYPGLVTVDAEPGEEDVYGDAVPLIVEWRRVRAELAVAVGRLAHAVAEERMRELEIEMIRERELTLPPSTWPWDESRRRDELRLREQTLDRVRRERAAAELRRWLRRVLTVGLWWD